MGSTFGVALLDDSLEQTLSSIHINSKKALDAGNLFIADVWSMSHGCGTWPAYWTVGNNGELNIVEGVNEHTFNQITTRIGAACQLLSTIASTVRRIVGKQCLTIDGNNAGCVFSLLITITAPTDMDST